MPLLEKKLFKRSKPPQDLDPNEKLFYCKATHEIFRQYDQFFERVILCNSLVWTCAMTGKSGITFQEAIESEENARTSIKTFPQALKKPVLYLASLDNKSRLNDLCDDVFNFVKDRFFVGEEVEVVNNGVKKSCEITQVVLPERPVRSPAKNDTKQKTKDINPTKIKYEVVDYNSGRTSVVKSENINRPKGTYTKPRNKLLLKHHTQIKDGAFKIKESVSTKMQLPEFPFSEVFPGPLPAFATEKKDKNTPRKKVVQGKLTFKKETMEERKRNLEKMVLLDKQKTNAEKERQKIKDNMKKQTEDEKLKQKEERLKEKEKKREEKKKIAEYLNSWKKPRDDLECDDLKDLPVATPIDCGIPHQCFGDAMMILEFLNTFNKQVQLKDVFPYGFSFDHIEKALVETDIQGVFNDLLQLLLTAIFRYQEAEHDVVDLKNKEIHELDNLNIDQAMDVAAITSTWPQKYHGTLLRNLPLDSFSVTEILRLHLLSSGHRPRISWQGVVSPSEDPGLYFKLEEPELLKKLEKHSVFELNCEERCKILSVLTNQILSGDVLRYAIDEYADNTKPLRNQLKELRLNFARKQREDLNPKKKEVKEKDESIKQEGTEEVPSAPVDEEEKENSKDLTPEEKAAVEEKKAKEAARCKAEFLRKEREMESQIRKLQSSFNLVPIGRDRAFRRYWVFQNVAGIFVEDDDPFKGVCFPKPVPQLNNIAATVKPETSATSIKKYLLESDTKNNSSDKENEILRDIAIVQSELPFPLKNRKLSDLNPRVDSKKPTVENNFHEIETCLQCVNKSEVQDNYMKYCPHSKVTLPSDQCSSNIDTCPVHNMNAPRTKWAFYYKEEDIDALINSLNPRGFRERSLKETLSNEKERIKELMVKCPYNAFNRTLPPQDEPQLRKSQRHQSSQNSSYAGMQPEDALELTLRDMILELEQRIYAGGLGCLKVSDREAWRAAIEQGAHRNLVENSIKEELSLKDDIESDILKLSLPVSIEKVMKDLATAMLELSQGIESKYLNPPLGDTDEVKKARQKQADAEQLKKIPKVSSLEKWQESLLQCSSSSQLFVHLGTLERSVAWSRSVLKAHCRICRRRGDAENMLLCDGCNRGHHLYCLKPPLKVIPEGDWFCLSCKPAEMPVSPTKKSRKAESESDAESDEEEEEEDEDDEEEDEESDEDEDEEESDEDYTDSSTKFQEACEACGDVGTLLCCDGCPLMYHAECVNLKRIPRGEWLCPKCSKKEEAAKKAQKHPSNGTYGTRSSSIGTDKKKSNPSLKTKMMTKGTKRKYETSFEEEFEPPSKKSNRDSAQNAARRRSKTGGDADMLDYKACIDMISELMRHSSSWPFLVPVTKKDAPGYHQKIKKPMDLGTIRSNLNCMKYKNNQEFVHDIYLVLHNCWLFNPKSSPEFKAADVLHKEIKKLFKEYQIADTYPANGKMEIENGF